MNTNLAETQLTTLHILHPEAVEWLALLELQQYEIAFRRK